MQLMLGQSYRVISGGILLTLMVIYAEGKALTPVEHLQQALRQHQQDLSKAQRQQETARRNLNEVNPRLEFLSQQINERAGGVAQTEATIADLDQQLTAALTEYRTKHHALGKELSMLIKVSKLSPWHLWFSKHPPNDIIHGLILVKHTSLALQQLLTAAQLDYERVTQLRREISVQRDKLAQEREELNQQFQVLEQLQQQYSVKLKASSQTVERLNHDIQILQVGIEKLNKVIG